MAERIPDSLIDDILNSTKKYSFDTSQQGEYSAADIEIILDDAKGYEEKLASEPVVKQKNREEIKFSFEKMEKEPKKFTFDFSRVEGIDEEINSEEIPVSVDDDGQIDIVSANEETIEIEETTEQEDPKPITGQISIEKTRMFNEIDIRGEYNPNISHNLGNKVTRTTSGDAEPLSSPVVNENKYKNHFFNEPVQKIESTMEHSAVR